MLSADGDDAGGAKRSCRHTLWAPPLMNAKAGGTVAEIDCHKCYELMKCRPMSKLLECSSVDGDGEIFLCQLTQPIEIWNSRNKELAKRRNISGDQKFIREPCSLLELNDWIEID